MKRINCVYLACASYFAFSAVKGLCQVNPAFLGDGDCDWGANNAECNWDDGDCCEQSCVDGTYSCDQFPFDCLDPRYSSPSTSPTASPSAPPSASPSASPTASPSASPSAPPTASPSASPSASPTASPSAPPTASPSASFMSTDLPMATDYSMSTAVAAVITIDSPDDDTVVVDDSVSDSVDDYVIIGDDDDDAVTLVDVFDICEDALEELDDITSISGESDEEAGEILLAICDLDCDVADLCLTDEAMADLEAGTLTDCSCAIIECNAACTLTAAAYSWKTWAAFAWMISILSIS